MAARLCSPDDDGNSDKEKENSYHGPGSESPTFSRSGGFHVPQDALNNIEAIMMKTEDSQRGNEISAPYEAPQFPIEQIEDKLKLHRQLSSFANFIRPEKTLPQIHDLPR
ncbi:hypothetical protein SK128_000567 [Halocaridina rubra]|uniref:Uncharacterized protein n=1 Tax=Halocaridina rubra TaxID=373956 RepID=A0AAN8X5Y3_HALRR